MYASHFIAVVICLIAILGRAGSLRAEEPMADCSTDPPCLALFKQAQSSSEQGNLKEASRLYKLAYAVRADPRLLYSIARVLHRSGEPRDALGYYQQFFDSPLAGPEDLEIKLKARQYIAEIQADLEIKAERDKPLLAVQSASAAGAPSVTPKAAEANAQRPQYKRWWLWHAVTAAVALGITGTVAGIYASDGGGR